MNVNAGATCIRTFLVAGAVLALTGCTGQQGSSRDLPNASAKDQQAQPTRTSAASSERPQLSKEDQVRLAVFVDWLTKYENRLKAPSAPPAATCYLQVEVDGKVTDPSETIMATLAARAFQVKKGSLCTKHGYGVRYGVVDKDTGKTGNYLLTVGAIKWIKPDVAELTFKAYQNGLSATFGTMHVRRQEGGWQAAYVGPVLRS